MKLLPLLESRAPVVNRKKKQKLKTYFSYYLTTVIEPFFNLLSVVVIM